jgi:hypothetical protein
MSLENLYRVGVYGPCLQEVLMPDLENEGSSVPESEVLDFIPKIQSSNPRYQYFKCIFNPQWFHLQNEQHKHNNRKKVTPREFKNFFHIPF